MTVTDPVVAPRKQSKKPFCTVEVCESTLTLTTLTTLTFVVEVEDSVVVVSVVMVSPVEALIKIEVSLLVLCA